MTHTGSPSPAPQARGADCTQDGRAPAPGPYRRWGKRALDVAGSGLLLLLSCPLILLAAAIVRTTMGGPVLFSQRRPGLHEAPFAMRKIRTMTDERGPAGEPLPARNRLTRAGSVLRKASIDELPQLWNVLRGDMSLVGPRPLFTKYLRYYTERERLRHAVRPGITGLAQVSGRNLISWEKRLELDAQYVEHLSLWLDLRILAVTVAKVLRRSDVAVDPLPDLDDYRSGSEQHSARGGRT